MKGYLDLMVAVAAFSTALFGIAKVKEQIVDEIQEVGKKLDIHLKEYDLRKEFVDYMFHALDEKINHKFNRLREDMQKGGGHE
jgi:hypothetical protein